MTRLRLSLAS